MIGGRSLAPTPDPTRRSGAVLAREAQGPTLVLGSPWPSLADALWERVPVVRWGEGDPARCLDMLRRAAELGVSEFATMEPTTSLPGAWSTVVWDLDGPWGEWDEEQVTRLLAEGGTLLAVGRVNRALDSPGPPRIGSATGVAALAQRLRAVGWKAVARPLPDPGLFCLRADRGESESEMVEAGEQGRVPVTVIIPTAGRSPWLGEAIKSVLSQSMRPERICVVSDGGAEPARFALETFGDAVDLIEIPKGGQAAAMNAGLATVKSPYVAWLDDDDRYLPSKLELQWRDLETHPEAVFSVTEHYAVDATGHVLEWRPQVRFDPSQTLRLLLGGSYFLGPTAMVRTERYRELGPDPYDVSLSRAQDYAMWFDLCLKGPVRFLPLALTEVRRHADNAQTPERTGLVRESARKTLRRIRQEVPLQVVFPAVAETPAGPERVEVTVQALLERAGHLLRVGLLEEALADLDEGIALAPQDARLHHFRGIVHLEWSRLDEAARDFQAAQAGGAPLVEVACALGTIAWLRGDRAGAARFYQRAVADDPAHPIARWNLALCAGIDVEAARPALEMGRAFLARMQPHGFLLSPMPPLEGMEAELVRLRRAEHAPGSDG